LRHVAALDVAVQSAVGAGDSFVGGMVLALARGEAPRTAFAYGMAAGAAAVARGGTAHPDPAMVDRLFRQLSAG